MNSQRIKYPKNWFEANRLVKNLEAEIMKINENSSSKRDRSKEILKIIKISYAILKSIDRAIEESENTKEIRQFGAARKVLSDWMKRRRFPEKLI